MTKAQDLRAAVAGERFTYAKRFQNIPACRGEHTVAPKSAGNSGQWVCISCGIPFDNQMEKDTHVSLTAAKKSLLKERARRARSARARMAVVHERTGRGAVMVDTKLRFARCSDCGGEAPLWLGPIDSPLVRCTTCWRAFDERAHARNLRVLTLALLCLATAVLAGLVVLAITLGGTHP